MHEAEALLGCRVHPVSRLDAATSGVLAAATTPAAARALQAAWAHAQLVRKTYLVLVAR